jgi:hypothetical protein
MTIRIDVKAEVEAAQKNLDDLQKRQVRRAAARALNRTGQQVRTRAVRDTAKTMGLTGKRVREAITLFKANPNALYAEVKAKGQPISLKEFKARQTRKGVTAKVMGERKLYRHRFIVQSLGGHVFEREGKKRFPIRKLWGPSVPAVFLMDNINKALRDHAAERWRINFDRELNFYLNRINK